MKTMGTLSARIMVGIKIVIIMRTQVVENEPFGDISRVGWVGVSKYTPTMFRVRLFSYKFIGII